MTVLISLAHWLSREVPVAICSLGILFPGATSYLTKSYLRAQVNAAHQ